MIKAVLLDRDGTINIDRGYVHKVEDFQFLPRAVEGLKRLYDSGYSLFVVTNQSGIARGYYTESDMMKVHDHMMKELSSNGVNLKSIVYCPHHPSVAPCRCRKPATGMLEFLISGFQIDIVRSYMVGDKASDVQAGKAVGLTTIKLGTGCSAFADYYCSNMLEASDIILGVKK